MSVRPRFQRAFLAWLDEARPRLTLQPRVIRRTNETLFLCFDGIVSSIKAEVSRQPCGSSCDVWVRPEFAAGGPAMLLYLDTDVVAVPGGYAFPYSHPAKRTLYTCREAAWRGLLFEPFLKWINEKLAKADSVALLWAESYIEGDPDRCIRSQHLQFVRDGKPLELALQGYKLESIIRIRSDDPRN